MILPLTNTLEYGLTFGKGSLKALKAAGVTNPAVRKALARGVNFGLNNEIEGTEETLQDLAQSYESGEPIDPKQLAESYVSGYLMGGILHGAGRAAQYLANRNRGKNSNDSDDGNDSTSESGADANARAVYERFK